MLIFHTVRSPFQPTTSMRIERVDHLRDLVLHLDPNLPLAIVVEVGRGLGRGDHAGVVKRVLAEQALVRLVELRARLDNQEEIVAGSRGASRYVTARGQTR